MLQGELATNANYPVALLDQKAELAEHRSPEHKIKHIMLDIQSYASKIFELEQTILLKVRRFMQCPVIRSRANVKKLIGFYNTSECATIATSCNSLKFV